MCADDPGTDRGGFNVVQHARMTSPVATLGFVGVHERPGIQLQPVRHIDLIAHWIMAHHERPAGRGYPEELTVTELPLAARILAVADSFWPFARNGRSVPHSHLTRQWRLSSAARANSTTHR